MAQNSVQMRSLFVGNIPKDLEAPEEYLATLFGKVGLVLSVKLCRDVSTQKSLGHAYVNFQNVADAERAQQQLNYAELPGHPGRELRVAFSERDPNVRARGKSLFVKNLDPTMSNKQLQELFAGFGTVIDCAQATDTQGKKLGFGTVQFAEDAAADKALESLQGKTINGKELVIAVKEREEDKTFTKIFVRGIKADATDDEIRVTLGAHAKPVGAVASLVVTVNPTNGTRSAIIDLGDHDAAVKAIEVLNEKKHETLSPGEAPITAVAYRKPAERRQFVPSIFQNDGRNLYVKYLPDHITEDDLRSIFNPYGVLESVSLVYAEGGVFRGFAFVCYKSREDADRAIAALHQHTMFNRPLYVQHAQHRDQRSQQQAERMRLLAAGAMGMMPPPGFGGPMGPMMMPPNAMMAGGRMMGPMGAPFGMNPMFRQQGPMVGGPRMGGFGGPGPMGMMAPRGFMNNGPRQFNNGPHGMRGPMNRGPHPNRMHQQNANIITAASLEGKTPEEQKNMLGERLYNNVIKIDETRAAKITGMLLELPTDEIIAAVNDAAVLHAKVVEAQNILAQHS